jgi:hypothetical protein
VSIGRILKGSKFIMWNSTKNQSLKLKFIRPNVMGGGDSKVKREREKERERESGAVGATSTPSTVGLFSFLTMLFLPTFS